MRRSLTGISLQAAAVLVALLLTLAALQSGPATSRAAEPDRIGGGNRFETAQLLAEATFDASVSDVVLATGGNFPDALAASALAGQISGPVLLTRSRSLPEETVEALQALSPTTVHIAGGPAAITPDVQGELVDRGYVVRRYDGEDRYETAALIAAQVPAASDTAIIATGQNYADALAGGPLAYAGPHPILLVRHNSVPEATARALTDFGFTRVVILGGTAAISESVETELESIVGSQALRLAGERREHTAVEIAEFAAAQHGFSPDTVLLANGWRNVGIDAVAAGPHGGATRSPILFVDDSDFTPAATAQYLLDHDTQINIVRAIGGAAVISHASHETALDLAGIRSHTFADVPLSWENEYRTQTGTFRNGEPGATATATITVDRKRLTLQFIVDYRQVSGPFDTAPGFHVHRGGITEEGPIVVSLASGTELAAEDDKILTGVVNVEDIIGDIDPMLSNPEHFYLNLHSDAYPAGAVRGQLPDGGQSHIPPP